MNAADLLTRITIWLALLGYTAGAISLLWRKESDSVGAHGRHAWTAGCAFFVAHVLCAFAFFHGWSHAAAYAETARQTEEMTGFRSGSGLYLNYLFGAAWIGMTAWWWHNARKFLEQPRWLHALWNGFAVFMIFNGTVVFGGGITRWFGLVLCAGLAGAWWMRWRANESSARR